MRFHTPNIFYSSTAPDFDLNISELNLKTAWYTLDNGLTNISFTGLTGTIDQTEWDKKRMVQSKSGFIQMIQLEMRDILID